MDLATILGIVTGLGLIFMAIFQGAGLSTYIDIPSVLITVGGTFAATLINYPLGDMIGLMGVIKKSFLHKEISPAEVIDSIVQLAERARREGILALESSIESLEDEFLQTGIRLAVDGIEADIIRDVLETELSYLEGRHKHGQSILEALGAYAPAFGMIGTLIGLVAMLKNMDDPSAIGPGMAVALLTTFYGAFMANLIFLPLAGKLKVRSQQELLIKELIIEGVMSIQSGDNPRIIEQKLQAFLSPKLRRTEEA